MSNVEDIVRRVIARRMKRGQRSALAQAAGHDDGSWVSNWLAKRQKHATLDEMAAMTRELGLSLAKIISLQEARLPPRLIADVQDPLIAEAVEALAKLRDDDLEYMRLTVQQLRATARLPRARSSSAPTGETTPVKSTKPEPARRR